MGARQARLLIVEDDADIREDLADLLGDRGYQTVTAANGVEALELLRSGDLPSLILLDLMMPVMDGWQLRMELLKDSTLARVPIILLSGAGNLHTETASLGAVGYVSKPFKLEQLISILERYC